MNQHARLFAAALTGVLSLGLGQSALAQDLASSTRLTAPEYGSGTTAGSLSNGNFNTPESDARPGVKFFALGVEAFQKGDYKHAIDMYKVAASWAYKPAEYNLGVMYFKGQGVSVDRALGAAWMVLAAERGDPQYVKARDLMITLLNKAEFAHTDELWGRLKKTYGDEVALRRAKAQWAWVKTHQTGTRVGGAVGVLHVGAPSGFQHSPAPPNAVMANARHGWMNVLQGNSIDGSVAYRQFQQSDNPYSPIFLKNRKGSVSVEPLQPVKPAHDADKRGGGPDRPAPSRSP
jgi:TPR repeat protein